MFPWNHTQNFKCIQQSLYYYFYLYGSSPFILDYQILLETGVGFIGICVRSFFRKSKETNYIQYSNQCNARNPVMSLLCHTATATYCAVVLCVVVGLSCYFAEVLNAYLPRIILYYSMEDEIFYWKTHTLQSASVIFCEDERVTTLTLDWTPDSSGWWSHEPGEGRGSLEEFLKPSVWQTRKQLWPDAVVFVKA